MIFSATLSYGKSRPKSAPAFRPSYCYLDKKVLRFFGYFIEWVGHSPNDEEPEKRVRHVQIMYYLEDDTIAIIEPKVKVDLIIID